jgi:soluble lytic murein transglycosylase-like protein
VRFHSFRSSIPLFDRLRDHSTVRPIFARSARVAPVQAAEWPARSSFLPRTGPSTTACLARWEARVLALGLLLFDGLQRCRFCAGGIGSAAGKRSAGNLFAGFIGKASQFAVPVRWISSRIGLERAGGVRAKSRKDAMGLMQIMPETWADLRLRYHPGNDPLRRSRRHFGRHGVSS